MSEVRCSFGAEVVGRDGTIGQLSRLVVLPDPRTVTHAVVLPNDQGLTARLVPIALVSCSGAQLQLACSTAEFCALPDAVEYDVLPPPTTTEVLLSETVAGRYGSPYTIPAPAEHEELPAGEIGLDRSWKVQASDGAVGMLGGLVLDSDDWGLRALIVREGHLFSHHDVTIPIDALAGLTAVVQLSLTRDELARRAGAS